MNENMKAVGFQDKERRGESDMERKEIYYGVMPLRFTCKEIRETVQNSDYPVIRRLQGAGYVDAEDLEELRQESFRLQKELSALSCYRQIERSVLCFSVNNLVCVFRDRTIDLSTPELYEHYTIVQNTFRDAAFAQMKEDLNIGSYSMLYLWYITVRNSPFEEFRKRYSSPLLLSFTSYPARIHAVPKMLESINTQSVSPTKTILWLGDKEFPEKEADLPADLQKTISDGMVSVEWRKDLKPHTKYFYAVHEYPEFPIITIDDDILYPEYLIECLLLSYIRHPDCVSAMRTEFIPTDDDGQIPSYNAWARDSDLLMDIPCMQLFATGVGGVLYPSGCLSGELLDTALIEELCLNTDDHWLKMMELVNDIPVVAAAPYSGLRYIEGTQDIGLWRTRNNHGGNDNDFRRVIEWVERKYGTGYFRSKLTKSVAGFSRCGFESSCMYFIQHFERLQKRLREEQRSLRSELKNKSDALVSLTAKNSCQEAELKLIRDSLSYRIGRSLTLIPRKIRDFLRRIVHWDQKQD